MSSFMRSLERGKVKKAMEDQKVQKKNKKLKPWWDSYNEKKHEYLNKLAERGYSGETRKDYEKRIRRKQG